MNICPHMHICICGNETDDIYKGCITPGWKDEHLWTIAVNDPSDCETKESVLEYVFYLPYQTNILHIPSVAWEKYPWHKLKDSVSALIDVVDG